MPKIIDKRSLDYRKRLKADIQGLTEHLQQRTGYYIRLDIIKNETGCYCYSARVSLDPLFTASKKFVLTSTGKAAIKVELLDKLLNFQQKNTSRGNYKPPKTVQASVHHLECCACNNYMMPNNFHRNIYSSLFKARCGYVPYCKSCTNKVYAEIYQAQGVYNAVRFLCGLYDRIYQKDLVDVLIPIVKSPVDMAGRYFQRTNNAKFNDRRTFVYSDP